eukprot:TRINITY_DN29427_c0_g1_i1.p1 TRINITY_DN29427_c0_g1~~TRINITY_DN29427_c0_g1_i1.p1  ORF type:complete len:310 (+),score=38.04 TRINITY_DN29427_c0_g1_i1:130-1059(+)
MFRHATKLPRSFIRAMRFGTVAPTTATRPAVDTVAKPSWQQLRRHFVFCAVPMVGFGMMDNTILIYAGDMIERHFGVEWNLSGLHSAACGQILSDFCGVLFGGIVEAISRKYVLAPGLTMSQFQLRLTQMVGTAGAAVGVVTGCILGMANFFFIDANEAERLKQVAKMSTIFDTVMTSAVETMSCPIGTCFLVDAEEKVIWTRASAGYEGVVRRPLTENASLAAWVATRGEPAVVEDARSDPRYCPDIEKLIGQSVKSVITYPIFAHDDATEVVGVLQFFNKPTAFTQEDARVMRLLCTHISIFIANCG